MRTNRLLILLLCCSHFLGQAQNLYPYTINDQVHEGNGIRLEIRRIAFGRSRPEARTILLVHGGGTGGFSSFDFSWNKTPSFATALAQHGFVVYLMNVRGWERSTAPNYDPGDSNLIAGSCQEAAADIDAVIDHIRKAEHIEKVNLFGWASGGHWASYYTTLHNDKVDNLIVLNTLYGVKAPWSLSSAFADPADTNRYNNHLPLYREFSSQSVIDARLSAVPFPDKGDWIDLSGLEQYARMATTWNGQHILRVPGGYRKESFYMAHGRQYWNAKDIRVPVLILRGQYDLWSRPIDATTYYKDLTHSPRKRSIELKQASHFVFLDKPDLGGNQMLDAIDGFIPSPSVTMTIANLKTDSDVVNFIHGFDGDLYHNICLVPPKPGMIGSGRDSARRLGFGAKSWEVADLDGDGTADLLVNGFRIDGVQNKSYSDAFVILSRGTDSFRIDQLDNGSYPFCVGKTISTGGQRGIAMLHLRMDNVSSWERDSFPVTIDTLTYRFGHFVERRQSSAFEPIYEIRYCCWGGYSNETGYGFTIHGDSAIFRKPQSWFDHATRWDSGGVFATLLDTATVHKIYGLLNGADIPSRNAHYHSNTYTDLWTSTLKVSYSSGSAYRIDDYGMGETYALSALFLELSRLRDSQDWKKIAPMDKRESPCQ